MVTAIRHWGSATELRMIVTNARSVYIGGPNDGEELVHAARVRPWPLYLGMAARDGGRHTYELDVAATTDERAVYRYAGHRPVHQ